MSYCKDCRFWSLGNGFSKRDPEARVCDKISFSWRHDLANIEVTVDDDQGLDTWLVTKGNFGCNLFQQKD